MLAHLQKWKPNMWIGVKGTKPETIARSFYTLLTLLVLPSCAEAKTKNSRAPDSETKLAYFPAYISEMLTQVCAEFTHVTAAECV